jgi:3-oxoacid CoA-transferase B subunit
MERLDENTMAMRVAREFEEGWLVNLGVGIPTLASSHVDPEKEIIFHSENGVMGFGPVVEDPKDADPNLINASAQPVHRKPGMFFVNHDEAFAMIRGGHVDLSVLGALQVAENGDLANYQLPGKVIGSLGGGQDLAFCAKRVLVVMTHQSKAGDPKLVRRCALPLTAPGVVDRVITDVGVFDVTAEGFVLREYVPGWSVEAIQAITDAPLRVGEDVREMVL